MQDDLLDREMYHDADAATLLRVPASTFRRWLDGGSRGGTTYRPVIRPEPTGSRVVTWGEFVEATYLRQYRREHFVKLQHLREFVGSLRDRLNVRYPLAYAHPWVGPGRRLLIAAQDEADVEPELWSVYAPPSGQLLLTAPSESFLERVSFSSRTEAAPIVAGGLVVTVHPLGKSSPVMIDPNTRFGMPNVGGVSTAVIREAVAAGEAVEALATDFGLTIESVAAAIAYEAQFAAAA